MCQSCMAQYGIKTNDIGKTAEITEEMCDIAGVLSITDNTDRNIKKSMESILRIADRLKRKEDGEKGRKDSRYGQKAL